MGEASNDDPEDAYEETEWQGTAAEIESKEKELDQKADAEKDFVPSDTMFVFMGTDFLFLDF